MEPVSRMRGHRWWPRIKVGIGGLVGLAICAMATSVALYIEGATPHRIPDTGPPAVSGTTVTFDIQSIRNSYGELVADVQLSPGPGLLDSAAGGLTQKLSVVITSTTTPVKRTWSRGMFPGVFPVPLTLARDIERWPFDRYYTGPVTVELFVGDASVPQRVNITFVDRLPGWRAKVSRGPGAGVTPYEVELQRSASTMVFAIVIICILISIAAVALFVAVQTLRDRRKFQSPMTTWYAAMLFAVVPLRNALPGSPEFGSWIDLTIVLWVLVALVTAMLLYIVAWWRHLKPDAGSVEIRDHPDRMNSQTNDAPPARPQMGQRL
jgi:hypothetical protein